MNHENREVWMLKHILKFWLKFSGMTTLHLEMVQIAILSSVQIVGQNSEVLRHFEPRKNLKKKNKKTGKKKKKKGRSIFRVFFFVFLFHSNFLARILKLCHSRSNIIKFIYIKFAIFIYSFFFLCLSGYHENRQN